jgi:hypothetical protein
VSQRHLNSTCISSHFGYDYRRFPKARVWPPLPGISVTTSTVGDDAEYTSQLPEIADQEYLLELYFTSVHPSFPVIHKRAFLEIFRAGCVSLATL